MKPKLEPLQALEQSREIIRKHCEKQPRPCYLMLDLEKPFGEIETTLKKQKKALEIIRDKRVDMVHFFSTKDCTGYNNKIRFFGDLWKVLSLTEEEYQILKETLEK